MAADCAADNGHLSIPYGSVMGQKIARLWPRGRDGKAQYEIYPTLGQIRETRQIMLAITRNV
jgi:hypothetical protein